MGLRSLLGKAAGFVLGGPIGGALGGAIGGYADDKQDRKRATAMSENYYSDLSRRAKAGGFHPLEALRSGGGQGYGPTNNRIPVGTSASLQNSYNEIGDIITGKAAKDDRRQELEDELLEQNVAIAKRNAVGTFGAAAKDPLEKDASEEIGPWSTYGTITLSTSWGNIEFPKIVADRLGIKNGYPLFASDLEDVAGDEASQVIFADWLLTNGIEVRGFDAASMQSTLESLISGGWDAAKSTAQSIAGSVIPEAVPEIEPATPKNNRDPQPGWMEEKFK